MDNRIENHQTVLSQLLNEYGRMPKSLMPNVKYQVIIDLERNQFQLLSTGWHNGRYIYHVAFHFAIIENKIWLLQNNTDLLLADELVERGVLPTEIVLGFIAPDVRAYTGFAAA